jgi:serine/threonine-protein kinase
VQTGTRLGSYEIIAALGSGGMGEVYRARDTRLERHVAIKVLPAEVVHDPDRLARFEREARVLAALNHPLIAQVYGFEQSGGVCAIVMELVEGITLDKRIAQGPIPIRDALHIARQLAEALETAHELGIIHRDLKPANIKLKVDAEAATRGSSAVDVENCTVKVLDFGLAKAVEQHAATVGDALNSPTLTAGATELGTILGTAAYMAPEQARGKPVDRRADIWAFGVVAYEMLTGSRPFKGEDVSDTLAAVLRQPVDLTALPAETPKTIRTLIERCLERNARQRLRDIGEARVLLEQTDPDSAAREAPRLLNAITPASRAKAVWLPWLLFAVAAAALVLTAGPWRPRYPQIEAPRPVTRLVSTLGTPGELMVDAGPAAVLSPDGRTIALRMRTDTTSKLHVRRLDQLGTTELAGTEGATNPFFSPDGAQLGFFAAGALKIIPLAGGGATTLTDAATGRGAAWDTNGDIIFQSSLFPKTPLVRVTATGQRTDRGTALAPEETTHRWPQILPGGKILYSGHDDVADWDNGNIRVTTAAGVAGKIVVRSGYHGTYVPSGHLLYMHAGTLYGVRFDLDRLEVTSPPAVVVESVMATTATGGAQYSVASNGTLAYVPGNPARTDSRIYWMTANGGTTALKTTPGPWGNPRFSPEGTRIALQVSYGSHEQIAIYDLATDRLTQLTMDAANHRAPLWTPDGTYIVYSSDESGAGSQNLYMRRADGGGSAIRLTKSANIQTAASVHPNGRFILFAENQNASGDLWVLPLDGNQEKGWTPGIPRPLINTPSFEALGAFSPDGRLIAYMSSEQGTFEIFVKSFDGTGGPWRVSSNGGAHPEWSRTERLLIYTAGDQLMAAAYEFDGRAFRSRTPVPWSPVRYASGGPTRRYDLHKDGQRVVVAGPDNSTSVAYDKIVFVFDFFDELNRLLPRK